MVLLVFFFLLLHPAVIAFFGGVSNLFTPRNLLSTSTSSCPKISFLDTVQKEFILEKCFPDTPFKFSSNNSITVLSPALLERDCVLESLVLPPELTWPSFRSFKQDDSSGKNIIFRRLKKSFLNMISHTIELLKRGKKIAWIGTPDIGKSHATMLVLVELLRNMKSGGELNTVLCRVQKSVSVYSLDNVGEIIQTEFPARSLDELESICEKYAGEGRTIDCKPVLVLELAESESDPTVSGMPILVTTSSRAVDSVTLKSMLKNGCSLFLVDPYSKEEAEDALLILHCCVPHYTLSDVAERGSWEEELRLMETRFDCTGGKPRYLFGAPHLFKTFQDSQTAKSIESALFKDLDEMTVYNIPSLAQYFLAPYLRDKVNIPMLNMEMIHSAPDLLASLEEEERKEAEMKRTLTIYEWRFLSEKVKLYFAQNCRLD